MRKLKKLIAGVSALALSFSMAASGMGAALPAVAADDTNDDWLHASGSRLYDSQGNEVWLTGANWFGFNCNECLPHYLWSGDIDDMVKEIADHGINVLRLPVSTELLYNWMIGNPDPIGSVTISDDPSYSVNTDLIMEDGSEANSQQVFEVLLKKCKKYGIKCFIDIHSPETNNSGHNYGIWYGKSFEGRDGKEVMVTTDLWIETLAWTADHYKNDDTLIGFDLKNEPHSTYGGGPVDAIWDDSDAPNNWRKAAEECANAVLAKNPNALIFIEGIEGYQGHGAWWGGNLRGVKDYPVLPTSGTSQIVYSPHDYGPVVSDQTWFEKNFTEQTLLDDYWYDTWAYLVEEDRYPLLIGEWGALLPDKVDEKALLSADANTLKKEEKNARWLYLLRNYMIAHHINHTYWCLNVNSGDTGGLWKNVTFSAQDGTVLEWDDLKYGIFEPSLWQTSSSGKYIGLDHQIPLGANGISLGEYYSTYAKSEGSNLDAGGKSDPKDPEPVPTDAPTEKPTDVPTDAPTEMPTDAPTEKPTDQPAQGLCGDVDESGKVDIVDVIALNKNLMIGEKLSEQGKRNAITTAGDTNRDPDAKDSLNILKYVVEIYDTLPV